MFGTIWSNWVRKGLMLGNVEKLAKCCGCIALYSCILACSFAHTTHRISHRRLYTLLHLLNSYSFRSIYTVVLCTGIFGRLYLDYIIIDKLLIKSTIAISVRLIFPFPLLSRPWKGIHVALSTEHESMQQFTYIQNHFINCKRWRWGNIFRFGLRS